MSHLSHAFVVELDPAFQHVHHLELGFVMVATRPVRRENKQDGGSGPRIEQPGG